MPSPVPQWQLAERRGDHWVCLTVQPQHALFLTCGTTHMCPCTWLNLRSACNRPFSCHVFLLGNLCTQENHSPLDTSQDSGTWVFPCTSWVLAAEGKRGDGIPRLYQPRVQMKQINSAPTWKPWCWSSCYGSLWVSSGAPTLSPQMVLSLLLFSPTLWKPQLRGKTEGTQSVPSKDCWGWGGSFRFLPAYICVE